MPGDQSPGDHSPGDQLSAMIIRPVINRPVIKAPRTVICSGFNTNYTSSETLKTPCLVMLCMHIFYVCRNLRMHLCICAVSMYGVWVTMNSCVHFDKPVCMHTGISVYRHDVVCMHTCIQAYRLLHMSGCI